MPATPRPNSLQQAASAVFAVTTVVPLLIFVWTLHRLGSLSLLQSQVGLGLALGIALLGYYIFRRLMGQMSDLIRGLGRAVERGARSTPDAQVIAAAQDRAPGLITEYKPPALAAQAHTAPSASTPRPAAAATASPAPAAAHATAPAHATTAPATAAHTTASPTTAAPTAPAPTSPAHAAAVHAAPAPVAAAAPARVAPTPPAPTTVTATAPARAVEIEAPRSQAIPGLGMIQEVDDLSRAMAKLWMGEAIVYKGRRVAVSVMNSKVPITGILADLTPEGLLVDQDGGKQVAVSFSRLSGIDAA